MLSRPPEATAAAAPAASSLAACAAAAARATAAAAAAEAANESRDPRGLRHPSRGLLQHETAGGKNGSLTAAAAAAAAAAIAAAAAAAGEGEDDVYVEMSDLDSETETALLHARMQQHQQLLRQLGGLRRKRQRMEGMEAVDVEWLLGSDPRRGFDLLSLDEKAAFLSLKYLRHLSA